MAALTGGVVLLLSHATAKAAVFLAAGNVLAAIGNDRIPSLCGMGRWLPVSAFALGLAGVALIGLPPSAGFMGKWLLMVAALEQGQWWWVAVLLLGSLLAAAYIIRLLGPAFVMPDSDQQSKPISRTAEWTAFALAALSVLLGFFATWPARLLAASLGSGATP
jgi:formate hydrogenlyase subunit 3/multisubunit Na+/H+ antiporter MnhD subunit